MRRMSAAPSLDQLGQRLEDLREAADYAAIARELRTAARAALQAPASAEDERLGALCERYEQFNYARQLYRRLLLQRPPLSADPDLLRERYARATYKDLELPVQRRLDRALEILGADGWLDARERAEAFGLAGAVYKRRWEAEGREGDLAGALELYGRGWRRPAGDP